MTKGMSGPNVINGRAGEVKRSGTFTSVLSHPMFCPSTEINLSPTDRKVTHV